MSQSFMGADALGAAPDTHPNAVQVTLTTVAETIEALGTWNEQLDAIHAAACEGNLVGVIIAGRSGEFAFDCRCFVAAIKQGHAPIILGEVFTDAALDVAVDWEKSFERVMHFVREVPATDDEGTKVGDDGGL